MRVHLIAVPLAVVVLSGSANLPREFGGAATTCSYTPGVAHIDVEEVQTFLPSDEEECTGLTIEISPDDGTAGFSSGEGCSLTSVTTGAAGIFKVRGCEIGSVTVTVRDGSTTLQTITVTVGA